MRGRPTGEPLTAAEIDRLQHWQTVHVEWHAGGMLYDAEVRRERGEVCFAVPGWSRSLGRASEARAVWLADEADPPPFCSICRREHGREIEHPCE